MLQKTDEEKKNINLLDCVKLFMVEEQLGEENPWYVGMFYYSCNHVNVYALTHSHMHMHTHACVHTPMHACTRMHAPTHTHTQRIKLV